MENIKTHVVGYLWVLLLFVSCAKEISEPEQKGNPSIEVEGQFTNVHFGDELAFTATVMDQIPLSTLTATLYFGEEEVSNTVIRTKDTGSYKGKIYVPFKKDIPDGTATLVFSLINTTLKEARQEMDVPITRAQYPYLILVTESSSYPMKPTGTPNEYAVTENFPGNELPAYIRTPVMDEKGSEITFGWEGGAISEESTNQIPFSSATGGRYSVVFNTKTYEAAPFFEILFNDEKMAMVDKDNYRIETELHQNDEIVVEGIGDLSDWWIDPDYFGPEENGKLAFLPMDGKYRITANLALKYLIVETMDGNDLANLKEDGTGAIWAIGERIGKPSVEENEVGWEPSKGLCLAPIGNKKYRLTITGGETVQTDEINFKFFEQKDWGGEFDSDNLTTESTLIFVGDGENGRDNGNLGLLPNVVLEDGVSYELIVDVSGGIDHAVLTVERK